MSCFISLPGRKLSLLAEKLARQYRDVRIISSIGFSLLEMITVLCVTFLISAIAFPQLNRYRHAYRLDSAVQTLASNLEIARYTAVSKNIEVMVVFNAAQASYQSFEDRNGNGVRDGNELSLGTFSLPVQVEFRGNGLLGPPSGPTGPVTDPISFSNDRIVLNPQGKLGSGLGSIYLQNYLGDAAAISFNIAGRMKVFRWDKANLAWK
jgi:Tfp pilus assembly protein FimT